jgi:Fur family transcriptional regulator, peroxide stress response regulator
MTFILCKGIIMTMEKKPHKTAQRAAILEYLKDNKSHPSVMDIYNHVLKQLSTISITTVYNTMDMLVKEGIVFELPMLHGEGRRYDPTPLPHDHLICYGCGRVVDINVGNDHKVSLDEEQRHGFDIDGIYFRVYGRCPECKSKRESKPEYG